VSLATPLAAFHPVVRDWFEKRFGAPTAPQSLGWPAIGAGHHTLITAPTGSGKTLAAFLWALDSLVQLGMRGELRDQVSVLYISPLKALSNDIQRNLQEPLAGIREEAARQGIPLPEIRSAVRTGDTPAPERTSMGRRPPHLLITTPESLFILLASERFRNALRTVRYLIVDEIHALAGTKRGVHLSLSLERVEALAVKAPQRIGLSATIHPLDEVAAFLVGCAEPGGPPRPYRIIDAGRRSLDIRVIPPKEELGAVATHPVWEATYDRLAALIREHRTTLVFANSRRLVERLAVHLTERLGPDLVAAHHGSLSRKQRLQAEARLKAGEINAIVATGSLELGIDIGTIDLVCQIESPRSVVTALQRIGRSGHWLGATPKGLLFPLTRDDLVECAALIRAVRSGALDRIEIPEGCLDVLAQQVAGITADEEWETEALLGLVRRSYCYRSLTSGEFENVLTMCAERLPTEPKGVAPTVYWDRVRGRVKGRRNARLAAITSGGTIPDTTNYDVYLEPEGIKLGQVEEDFAQESMKGDIFTLGNAPWRIVKVERGRMVVESAAGLPPTIPFWHGEAPGRTGELSREVGRLRRELAARLDDPDGARRWLQDECGLDEAGARIAVDFVGQQAQVAGVVPDGETLLAERFFDSLGGTQIVLHTPFGMRVNRAWGLALSKRLCRTFNFEIQSAATDDAILLSLGPRHSFPLDLVWAFLSPESVKETLTQAVLAAPLFETRFRHAAVRALLIPRFQRGRKVPAYLQRLRATDLLAACFPAQQACQDNRIGEPDIPVPDYPLVRETLRECLEEALDLPRLTELLSDLRAGRLRTVTKELPLPSAFAHKILAAWDYSYLDDAPREERRSRTVTTHRGVVAELLATEEMAGFLAPEIIARVIAEVSRSADGFRARDVDELVELLLKEMGPLDEVEIARRVEGDATQLLDVARSQGRAVRVRLGDAEKLFWVAVEDFPLYRAAYDHYVIEDDRMVPASAQREPWEPEEARRELIRRRLRHVGPSTPEDLAEQLALASVDVARALAALEAEGSCFQGRFVEGVETIQFCERTILERIHRATLARLRQEIEPVAPDRFVDFLCRWQHVAPGGRLNGADGLSEILTQLQGLELPASSWERDILPLRLAGYRPELLDQLGLTGAFVWGRLVPGGAGGAPPLTFFQVDDLSWLRPESTNTAEPLAVGLSDPARRIHERLQERGASFLDDVARGEKLEPADTLSALWELVSAGRVTNDTFTAVRFALEGDTRSRQLKTTGRPTRSDLRLRVKLKTLQGRWSLLPFSEPPAHEERVEAWARCLLTRYGILFRELLALETAAPPWRELVPQLRRWELGGRLRAGRFVEGVSGEQYALPEAVELLRAARRSESRDLLVLSTVDPINLYGPLFPCPVTRRAESLIVLEGGRPILALEGSTLRPLADLAPEALDYAIRALTAERRGRRFTIERWDETPVLDSPVEQALRDAGFYSDGIRLIFDGYTGPRVPWR